MSCWDYTYAWLIGHLTVCIMFKKILHVPVDSKTRQCSTHQHLPEVQHPDPLLSKKIGVNLSSLSIKDCTYLALRKGLYCVVSPVALPSEVEKVRGAVWMRLLSRCDECRKKALQVDVSLIVLPANMGNKKLIHITVDYNQKITTLFGFQIFHQTSDLFLLPC
jgi:hypothetical protein